MYRRQNTESGQNADLQNIENDNRQNQTGNQALINIGNEAVNQTGIPPILPSNESNNINNPDEKKNERNKRKASSIRDGIHAGEWYRSDAVSRSQNRSRQKKQ